MIKKKLLFIVNVDWFFRSHRLPLALEAVRRGYEVHLLTEVTSPTDDLEAMGLTIHPYRLGRSSVNPLQLFLSIWAVLKILKSIAPEVVHLVAMRSVLIGGLATRIYGKTAVVAAMSGLGYVFSSSRIKARLVRYALLILLKEIFKIPQLIVIFQNSSDAEIIKNAISLSDEKVQLIRGSGVDLGEFHVSPLPAGPPIVMMASRLLEDKGVRIFVEAAKILARKNDSIRFWLVGDPDPGNPTSIGVSEIDDWKRDGVVEILGHRSDMAQVLSEAHLVVLPSYYGEGLPKVLIEAAACGRAVITTDWPGCRDAIIPNQTGILVPPRDAQSLAQAIALMLSDRNRLAEMGKQGRVLAEAEYGIDQIVQKHFDLYEDVMSW